MNSGYRIEYHKRVPKTLRRLGTKNYRRIVDKIEDTLIADPYSGKKLKGRYKGLYSLRVGRYRIIYQIIEDERAVYILKISERQGVYDDLLF